MTFPEYINLPVPEDIDSIECDIIDSIEDDGEAIFISFGSTPYEDDSTWSVETGLIIRYDDDRLIEEIEPTARLFAPGESGLGEIDEEDWTDEKRIEKALSAVTGVSFHETWLCSYWVSFGRGENSEECDLDVPCTEGEYAVLKKLEYMQNEFFGDVDDEDDAQSAIEESEGLFASAEDMRHFADMSLEDLPELEAFVQRVEDMVYAAREHDCEMSGDEDEGDLAWNYGDVE